MGNYRHHNEDRCVTDAKRGVFLVVDGVGGQVGGEEASEIIARVVPDWIGRAAACWRDRDLIQAAVDDSIEASRQEMIELADRLPSYRKMSATLALVVVADGVLYATHVGDCRVYLLRRGQLRQLTKDQTFVQAAIDGGLLTPERARSHMWRHVVTNTVGVDPLDEPAEVHEWLVMPGDRLLLCSDGLTDDVADSQLKQLLSWPSGPQHVADALVDLALEHGSRDNVTCVVVDVVPEKA